MGGGMGETKVVNIKRGERYDVYIGRGTPFGNPYVIGQDGSREEVIRKHAVDFEYRIEHDAAFREKVLALRGKALGCHCMPLSCHGLTIVDWLRKQEAQTV